MTIAFVLGNGKSREPVDFDLLKNKGKVFACNAVYRTHTPHVLVSTDRPISRAIQESGYSLKNTHYTRRPLPDLGAHRLPRESQGWSSGPNAAYLAAQDSPERIYLLGFDLGGGETFNNVFADTEFYKKSHERPTTAVNWIRQLGEIIEKNPHIHFVRVVGSPDVSAEITQFNRNKNFSTQTISAFLDFLQA